MPISKQAFSICVLLALAYTLPACDPARHDQTIIAELQYLLPADDNPEEWADLSYEVEEGDVSVTIPGWMAEDAEPLKETIKTASYVKSVNVEVDEDAAKTPALLVVSQSEGGAWSLSGGMPDQAFVTQIVTTSENVLRTDQLATDFRIAREFAEPTWLPHYQQSLTQLAGALLNLTARFEVDTVTLSGTCLDPAYCAGLTTVFDELGLSIDAKFDSYASLTVDQQPDGLSVTGIVNATMDRPTLFECLFGTETPPENATVSLENESAIHLPAELFGNWCATLRGLQPPLTNYTASFAGPRVQISGEVESLDDFNEVVQRFPSTDSYFVRADLQTTDTLNVLEATCGRSRWTVTGTVESADTVEAIEQELSDAGHRARVRLTLTTRGGSGADPKTVEAIRYLPLLCSAVPDGSLRLSGKQLTIFGTAETLADIQAIREAAQESQRLEIRFRVRAYEDDGLRELQRQIDEILAETPITFERLGVAFDDDGSLAMARISEVLRVNPDARFRLFVHSDGPGSARFHEKLSQDRASAIMDAIYRADANDHRVQVYTPGNEMPIADTTTAEGEAENTRVELLVSGRLQ